MGNNKKVFALFLWAVLMVFQAGFLKPVFALDGPVQVIPGGYTIHDTDPGSGEQWGRPGGRTLTLSDFQLDQLHQLLWGASNANSVIITFDGDADAEGENNLSYTVFSAQGYIEWTGQTRVELFTGSYSNGMFPVDTKFRLTIKDHSGNPVLFATHPSTGLPLVDVYNLPLNPSGKVTFSATLEVFAKNPSNAHTDQVPGIAPTPEGQYGPALDVFDCLHTDPGQYHAAITSFNWGFFYEKLENAMTLKEHDEHLVNLFAGLDPTISAMSSYVNFIFEDWPLKFKQTFDNQTNIISGLSNVNLALNQNGATITELNGYLQPLPQKIDELSLKFDNVPFQEIISQLGNKPNLNLMLLLFGIEGILPPDPNLPPFQVVKDKSFLYQSLTGIDGKADQLNNSVSLVQADLGSKISLVDGKVNGVSIAVHSLGDNMRDSIAAVNEKVNNVDEKVGALATLVTTIQSEIAEHPPAEISLEVVDKNMKDKKWEHSSKDKYCELNLIVLLKEEGKPAQATIISVEGIIEIKGALEKIPVEFQSTGISDGVVALKLTFNHARSPETFIISAKHEISKDTFIHGTSMFSVND